MTNDKINDKSGDNQSEARISVAYNKDCHLSPMTSFVKRVPEVMFCTLIIAHKSIMYIGAGIETLRVPWIQFSTGYSSGMMGPPPSGGQCAPNDALM